MRGRHNGWRYLEGDRPVLQGLQASQTDHSVLKVEPLNSIYRVRSIITVEGPCIFDGDRAILVLSEEVIQRRSRDVHVVSALTAIKNVATNPSVQRIRPFTTGHRVVAGAAE